LQKSKICIARFYARVSTVDQNLALQRDALTEAPFRPRGWATCLSPFDGHKPSRNSTALLPFAMMRKDFHRADFGRGHRPPALHDALEFARSVSM
jgi:hypothetical protein